MLVLIPLLGFTYLITIAGPTDKLSLAYYVFNHVRALLLSIQVSSEFCLAVCILDLSLQTSYMYCTLEGAIWLSWNQYLDGMPFHFQTLSHPPTQARIPFQLPTRKGNSCKSHQMISYPFACNERVLSLPLPIFRVCKRTWQSCFSKHDGERVINVINHTLME